MNIQIVDDVAPHRSVLVVAVGTRSCAIPLAHVAETMRPLPIEPVPGTPPFVRGVSVVRGVPIPVIDLRALLENNDVSPAYGRFVTLRVDDRSVALGVNEVIGVRTLDTGQLQELPHLLRDVATGTIEALGVRDARLLLVLRAARIVPDDVWPALAGAAGAAGGTPP